MDDPKEILANSEGLEQAVKISVNKLNNCHLTAMIIEHLVKTGKIEEVSFDTFKERSAN